MTKTYRTNFVATLLVIGLTIATTSTATLLVYEGFNYVAASGAQLDTLTGTGTGWGGNWTDTGSGGSFQNNDFFVGTLPPSGGMPTTTGGAANKSAVQTSDNSRQLSNLSTSFEDGDTVWFSYVLALRNPISNQFNMGFASSANTASGIGISIVGAAPNGTTPAPASLYARVDGTLSASSVGLTLGTNGFGTVGMNQSFFVVGRLILGAGAGNDVLDVWVNGGTSLSATPTLTVSGVTLGSTPDRFNFFSPTNAASAAGNPLTAVWYDEIKLGETAADLGVSVVPEPSSAALLLLGVGVLLRLRQRAQA